jgi:hypothetical protein
VKGAGSVPGEKTSYSLRLPHPRLQLGVGTLPELDAAAVVLGVPGRSVAPALRRGYLGPEDLGLPPQDSRQNTTPASVR